MNIIYDHALNNVHNRIKTSQGLSTFVLTNN